MNRLLEIKFEPAGHWLLKGDALTYELFRHASQQTIRYAFISDGEVKYVGKTVRSLHSRIGGYKNPASSQTTNVRNNSRIIALLQSGAAVDILALPDNGLLHYGQFHINLAAGLEDSIISLLKPEWNGNTVSPLTEMSLPIESLASDECASFSLLLQKTYFNRGFFNIGVGQALHFGSDGQEIEIFCGNAEQPIIGIINRTANNNKTPRIMGGKGLRDWFQHEMSEMQEATITMLSRNAIRIEPRRD